MRLYRMQELKDYIQQHEKASIDELCQAMGGVQKHPCGATWTCWPARAGLKRCMAGVKYRDSSQLIPYENRGVLNAEAKRAIGRRAGELVEESDVLFFGFRHHHALHAGIAERQARDRADPQHFGHQRCRRAAGRGAVCPARPFYYPKTKSFRCMDTAAFLRKYNITKAFMAASGFSRRG